MKVIERTRNRRQWRSRGLMASGSVENFVNTIHGYNLDFYFFFMDQLLPFAFSFRARFMIR